MRFFRLFDSVPILESCRALYLEYKDGCCVSRRRRGSCKWRVTAFYLGVMVSRESTRAGSISKTRQVPRNANRNRNSACALIQTTPADEHIIAEKEYKRTTRPYPQTNSPGRTKLLVRRALGLPSTYLAFRPRRPFPAGWTSTASARTPTSSASLYWPASRARDEGVAPCVALRVCQKRKAGVGEGEIFDEVT